MARPSDGPGRAQPLPGDTLFTPEDRAGAGPRAAPGPRIGRYQVERELGRGGMGVVYVAFDPTVGRRVALKMIVDPASAGPDALRRFQREASAAGRLRHPGIVALHEVGEHEGRPYLVMELVEGESLEATLRRSSLPPRRIAEIVRDVALALAHAHAAGFVHRDVKPENVLLDRDLRPRLVDFGIAREVAADDRMTRTGQILGTPAYMAPEQAGGDTELHGPLCDVYSLGAVLYRALVGRPPFQAPTTAALLTAIIMNDPEPPRAIDPGVHPDLETIALRCLEKEPGRRYPTAAAVADELSLFLEGRPIVARPVGRIERTWLWARRNRRLSLALAALVLVVVASIGTGTILLAKSAEDAENHAREEKVRQKLAALRVRAAGEASDHRFKLAIATYGEILALAPRSADDWYRRGKAKEDMGGDPDGAIADFSRAVELDPKHASAYLARGNVLSGVKHDDVRALADYTRAFEADPTLTGALTNRAYLKEALGDHKGAEADCTRALAADPESITAHFGRAFVRAMQGELELAIADFSFVIQKSPGDARAWTGRAKARKDKGDFDGALADFSMAVDLNPHDPIVWGERGSLRRRAGDLAGARADYDRSLQLGPGAGVYVDRAALRIDEGDPHGAIDDCARALELDARCAPAYRTRAVAETALGDRNAAFTDCSRAIELAPRDADAWGNRGVVRSQQGDLEGAIDDLTRSIELSPRNVWALKTRAAFRLRVGEAALARDDATRALEVDAGCLDALLIRGDARARTGDREGAAADYARFLELAPDHPNAAKVKAALESMRGGG